MRIGRGPVLRLNWAGHAREEWSRQLCMVAAEAMAPVRPPCLDVNTWLRGPLLLVWS